MTKYDACIKTLHSSDEDFITRVYDPFPEAMSIAMGNSTKPSLLVKGNHYRLFNKMRGGCSFKNLDEFYKTLKAAVSNSSIVAKNGENKLTKDSLPESLVDLVKKENLTVYSMGPEPYIWGKINMPTPIDLYVSK